MFAESAALRRIQPSATLAADAKARELKAAGRDVIGLLPASQTSTPLTTSRTQRSRRSASLR